jgi:D-arabinono-1,4-lactone oxidase
METFRDAWFRVLPCDDQVRVDTLIKIIFTELWLPLDQLTVTLDRLSALLEDQAVAGNFAIELYGARQSPFWLSPSHGHDVVRVDVFWWAYNIGDPRERFAHFWKALLDLPGTRLHWGKHLPDVGQRYGSVIFDRDFLRNAYPRLDDWLSIRRAMDPDGVFVTDYWRRVFGL